MPERHWADVPLDDDPENSSVRPYTITQGRTASARPDLGLITVVAALDPPPARLPVRGLEPEHRRDGAGLFLLGLAAVVAACVWWQIAGSCGDGVRTLVAGTVGLLAWVVPVLLVVVAYRNLRDPDRNGPAGRQLIGWSALLLGVLGMIPLPSKWIIRFGEQIATDELPDGAADDPLVIFNVTDQVRDTIQQSLYELLGQRRYVDHFAQPLLMRARSVSRPSPVRNS